MPNHLFHDTDLLAVLRKREQSVSEAANAVPAQRALALSVDELAAALVEDFEIAALEVLWAEMTAHVDDAKVDVSRDWLRGPFDSDGPVYVPGTRVTYYAPFTGEAKLFGMRPSTSSTSLPSGVIADGHLQLTATTPASGTEGIKRELDRQVTLVTSYVGWVNSDISRFNAALPSLAHRCAGQRREKVLADAALATSLGVPLRRRDDAPTYPTNALRRKITSSPVRPRRAHPPEPVVLAEVYEHILEVVRSMALVLERSPKTFSGMGEEAIRDHFLVQLNGHYQGTATGETFNGEGKTDILVREAGRNVFIAECKIWRGVKTLSAAIDQMLSYASWRDTKTAILLFSRNRDTTRVLELIAPAVASHASHVRTIHYGGETDFRFVLRHGSDPDRELTLTVLVFGVPA